MIAGYQITKMKKWKRMCGGIFTMMIVGGECLSGEKHMLINCTCY